MSWNDFYRRRDALNAVLEHARDDQAGELPFAEVPDVAEVFTGPEELLRALHYKWVLALTGQLGVALSEAERSPDLDPVDATSAAWRATAATQPVLRRLLDEHADGYGPAMHAAIEGEQRLVALAAGLAEPHEPKDEVTRIGATYLTLLRTTPKRPVRRRGPVEQLLRRLVPSA